MTRDLPSLYLHGQVEHEHVLAINLGVETWLVGSIQHLRTTWVREGLCKVAGDGCRVAAVNVAAWLQVVGAVFEGAGIWLSVLELHDRSRAQRRFSGALQKAVVRIHEGELRAGAEGHLNLRGEAGFDEIAAIRQLQTDVNDLRDSIVRFSEAAQTTATERAVSSASDMVQPLRALAVSQGEKAWRTRLAIGLLSLGLVVQTVASVLGDMPAK